MSETPQSPYKGLSAFSDSDLDALFFFGREREREIIVANLIASRLTVLYGPSGVGKSSILHAAVARELRELPEQPLVLAFSRWSEDPTGVFAEAMDVARAGARDVYVLLDQLEEYFLYRAQRNGLGDELAQLLHPELRLNVLLSLREDELAKIDRFKASVPSLFGNVLPLRRLDRDSARAAIVEPLGRWREVTGEDVSAEPALVDAVLDEVAEARLEQAFGARGRAGGHDGGGVEAPFLQLVMQRLWEVEREEGSSVLRAETFRRLGGAQRIVAEHLGSAVATLSPRQEDVVARLFHHLVTPSGSKVAHGLADLAGYAEVDEEALRPVLATLATRRILRPLEGGHGVEQRFEIFHDVLADPVLAWRAQHESARALEREREAARKRHRRLALLSFVSLGLLAVMAGIAVFALTQRSEARERAAEARDRAQAAKARELAATASTQLSANPELALILASRANELEPAPGNEAVLRDALVQSRVRDTAALPAQPNAIAAVPGRFYVLARGVLATYDTRLRRRNATRLPGRIYGIQHGAAVSIEHGELVLRDLASGSGERYPLPEEATHAKLVAVSPSRTFAVLANGGTRIVVADLVTGGARHVLEQDSPVTALAFSPGARLIAVGCSDGSVRLWRPGSGALYAEFRPPRAKRITRLAFSPRGTLVAGGGADGVARIWNAAEVASVATLVGHATRIVDIAFAPDGATVVTTSTDGTARVWRADNGGNLAVLRGHGAAVTAAAFTSGGSEVVTGSVDRTLRLWDARAQRTLEVLKTYERAVIRLDVLSQRHLRVVTADDRERRLDVQNRSETPERPARPPRTTAAVVISGNSVRVSRAGSTVVLRGHSRRVTSAHLSGDGTRVVTASADGDVRIWDASSGRSLHTLRGHLGTVADATFSRDGRWVLSAGPTTGGLWDAEEGRLLFYLRGHVGRVNAAVFDPSGTRVFTGGADGTVRVYVCDVCGSGAALAAAARERLRRTGRQLTPDERRRYLGDG